MSDRYRVIETWRRSYDPALAVKAGQRLTVERRDEEWPGWLWCVDDAGLGGWLPEAVLEINDETARARKDFDTVELTVVPGDIIEALGAQSDWVWSRTEAGAKGWLPLKVLEAL